MPGLSMIVLLELWHAIKSMQGLFLPRWYFGRGHGQHIGFFRVRTLEKLARERGKFLLSNGTSYDLIIDKPANQKLWKVMIRANRILPLLLPGKLVSKVWSDHNLMT